MMAGLAARHVEAKTVMIEAAFLKAHRTASRLDVKKGDVNARLTAQWGVALHKGT